MTRAPGPLPPFERVAHRGAPREFPENTLPAFERALERGADAIELDVHRTADGEVVVHHDPALGTTVGGGRRGAAIDSLTWQELQAVELAPGITIPSLSQVLDLVQDRATVYIELKGRDVAEAAIATIRGTVTRCAVHSFDHAAVQRCVPIAPDLPRGLLYDVDPIHLEDDVDRAAADAVWVQWRLVNARLGDRAHAAGARLFAWTVNTRATASHLLAAGVDAICTDDLRLFGD